MPRSLATYFVAVAALASTISAQFDPQLTGTWSTKSNKVFTGPVSGYIRTKIPKRTQR